MFHMTTTNSLRAGIDQTPSECHVCKHNTFYMDWVGASCDTCGADTAWLCDGDLGGFIRSIRTRCGLSRKDVSDAYGCSTKTIKSYEWGKPSNRYYDWFVNYIKEIKTPHIDQ